jgi:hypothetical protein
VANDTYLILRKDPKGQYASICTSMGRDRADSCVALLKANKPGKYLLLNLRTNMIEEWKKPQEERPALASRR